MSENIKDKVIVITGASSGIGKATALLLAEKGAKIALGARNSSRLEELANQIIEKGGTATYQQADVKNRADLQNLVNHTVKLWNKIDVLINNAGIGPISPMDELRVDDWDNMIDINIKGVLYGIAASLPIFRQQGFGHIINTASTAGFKTVANQTVYSATKYAVRAISEGLRQEAGDKLKVTIISPGFVQTDFAESMTNEKIKSQIIEAMDKIAISPEAIARAMLYAIEQPEDVDVGEIVIRPTAQT